MPSSSSSSSSSSSLAARRNRRRPHSPISHDRWLVSYADFITLLFAFFTTMYAISNVDAKKLQEMVQSMQHAFDARRPAAGAAHRQAPPPEVVSSAAIEAKALEALKARLAERLKLQIAGGQVGLEVDPRGLVISIREAGTFAVGSADLSVSTTVLLAEVAAAMLELENQVRVEGHTDDVPIHTARFRSNWELSTARATNVVAFLMSRGLPPTCFSAAGYGEFHPRVPNSDQAARAQNRRVDIVILNEATRRAEEPGGTAPPTPSDTLPSAQRAGR